MPEQPLPRVVLLPDEPITDWNDDKLDTARIATVIASAAHHTESPFTIGVFGRWGQGKTSVLRQAESLIADNYEDDVTVWFNAWQYERDEIPIVPLILTIAEKLENQTKSGSHAKEYLHKTGRILSGIARAASLSISTPFPGPTISVSGKELTDEISKALENCPPEILPSTFYMKAFDALTKCADEYKRNTEAESPASSACVIIFIDDLDRCLPKQAVELLEGIKLVLSQPGFVFILGLDRQILEDHLVKIYKEAGSRNPTENGRRFIDKIIQLPLPLPRQDNLAGYIEKLFELSELKLGDNKPIVQVLKNIKEIIAVGANANPRNVVRFINNLIVDRSLWIGGLKNPKTQDKVDEIDTKLLGVGAVSRILREHLGDSLYVAVSKDRGLCTTLASEEGLPAPLLKREEEREYLAAERLRREIFQHLDEAPFLQKLLRSKFGMMWLADHDLRVKVDRFLHEERGEEGKRDSSEIVKQAIINGDEIPLSDKELAKVEDLRFDGSDIDDTKLARLEKLMNLKALDLRETKITDAGLSHLEKLINLKGLWLSGPTITDAGLTHLEKLTNLWKLNLSETEITDTGLACLEKLASLGLLDLSGTQITDAGLVHLEKFTWLNLVRTRVTNAVGGVTEKPANSYLLSLSETELTGTGLVHLEKLMLPGLSLSETGVTDVGLVHLEKLTNLRWLCLSKTQITNAGLVCLEKLTNLRRLELRGIQLTDAGLIHLEKLTNLWMLDLSRTQVTDTGLVRLEELVNLRVLVLMMTKVTGTGLNRLRKRLPSTRIIVK